MYMDKYSYRDHHSELLTVCGTIGHVWRGGEDAILLDIDYLKILDTLTTRGKFQLNNVYEFINHDRNFTLYVLEDI